MKTLTMKTLTIALAAASIGALALGCGDDRAAEAPGIGKVKQAFTAQDCDVKAKMPDWEYTAPGVYRIRGVAQITCPVGRSVRVKIIAQNRLCSSCPWEQVSSDAVRYVTVGYPGGVYRTPWGYTAEQPCSDERSKVRYPATGTQIYQSTKNNCL